MRYNTMNKSAIIKGIDGSTDDVLVFCSSCIVFVKIVISVQSGVKLGGSRRISAPPPQLLDPPPVIWDPPP